MITSRKRPLNLGIRWVVALRRCDCKNKLTLKIAFSEHLLVISRFFLPRRGLFASLGSLEEGKGKRTGNNGTRRKKEGNRAFLFFRRPTRFNYSYSFIQNVFNEIPVGASAKESVLAAYVSIGNEAKQLQNSQLNGMGNAKLVRHLIHFWCAFLCNFF